MTTMIRMKKDVIRHQYIITTDTRDDISTQYNIVICICYIAYVYGRDGLYRIDVEMVGVWNVWE